MIDPDATAPGLKRPGDWMKSPTWLANAGHFLAGYAWMTTTFLFDVLFARAQWVWGVLVVSQVFAASAVLVKEYVIDLRDETGETIASSTEDALGYALGMMLTWIIIGALVIARVWPR